MLLAALKEGCICVVDISQMRGTPALILSGLILQKIFDHNQQQFTHATPETIPAIAVVEEAQAVLGHVGSSGEGPYVSWVKEGRKYDLGAMLITQQPGSISSEILSQGDSWFVFHLLSAGDLNAIKKANAHFSDDLLSSLLNEPLPGHGVFWSSVGGKSYPIPIRVLSFEEQYQPIDPQYSKAAVETGATRLRARFAAAFGDKPVIGGRAAIGTSTDTFEQGRHAPDEIEDSLEKALARAVEAVQKDETFLARIRTNGIPWRGVVVKLAEHLPDVLQDREEIAYNNVARLLDAAFGGGGWKTERRAKKGGSSGHTTWVVLETKRS